MECSFKDRVELLEVCILDLQGQFDSKLLSPPTTHTVSFRIKLHKSLYGINTESFKQGDIYTCLCLIHIGS